MMTKKMSADKSHLLAYLKHTPGFEQQVRTFVDLPTKEDPSSRQGRGRAGVPGLRVPL